MEQVESEKLEQAIVKDMEQQGEDLEQAEGEDSEQKVRIWIRQLVRICGTE
jgi:hypothetical protein